MSAYVLHYHVIIIIYKLRVFHRKSVNFVNVKRRTIVRYNKCIYFCRFIANCQPNVKITPRYHHIDLTVPDLIVLMRQTSRTHLCVVRVRIPAAFIPGSSFALLLNALVFIFTTEL